jgi:hypothetical protein
VRGGPLLSTSSAPDEDDGFAVFPAETHDMDVRVGAMRLDDSEASLHLPSPTHTAIILPRGAPAPQTPTPPRVCRPAPYPCVPMPHAPCPVAARGRGGARPDRVHPHVVRQALPDPAQYVTSH